MTRRMRPRQLSLAWENWPDWNFQRGKQELERKLYHLIDGERDKSAIVGAQFEYDTWMRCKPLADAGIKMERQRDIYNKYGKREGIADIYLYRINYYGPRDVILSVKDLSGPGSHDKKITDDLDCAYRNGRIPIEIVIQGNYLGESVRSALAQRGRAPLYPNDFADWVQKIVEAQLLPIDALVRIHRPK